MLKGTNLYLIGMMGAGKSTVGKLLAEKLRYKFMDTDVLIEKCTGQTIAEIFAESGEAVFRQIEHQVLGQVSVYTGLVVATGGGIVLDNMNWLHLRDGIVIWLDVPVPQLYQRLVSDSQSRPLLATADPLTTLSNIYAQRCDRYAEADIQITIHSSESPQAVSDRLLQLIELKVLGEFK